MHPSPPEVRIKKKEDLIDFQDLRTVSKVSSRRKQKKEGGHSDTPLQRPSTQFPQIILTWTTSQNRDQHTKKGATEVFFKNKTSE